MLGAKLKLRKEHIRYLAPPLLLGFAAFYFSHLYAIRLRVADYIPQAGPPVSFTSVKKSFSATGRLSESKTRVYRRFHHGSIVNSYSETFPQQKPLITEILNVSAGKWQFLDSVTRSVTTLRKTPGEITAALANLESEGCPDHVDLSALPEAESIAGIRTVYYVHVSNGEKIERWMAPDLACLNLKEISTSYEHNGAHNEEEVVSIKPGEPPEDALQPPPSYVERTPREVEDLHTAATGGDVFWGAPLMHAVERASRR